MKLSSRHIIPLMLVCVMLTGLFSSCQRKPLYLAQRGTLDINVSVYDIQLELLWGVSWKTDWQYLWDESLYGYIGYTEPMCIPSTKIITEANIPRATSVPMVDV